MRYVLRLAHDFTICPVSHDHDMFLYRMSDEFYADFVRSVPPPIKHLLDKYFMPDFENVVMTMRDAPTLAFAPKLKRVPCCNIAFCFPCVI